MEIQLSVVATYILYIITAFFVPILVSHGYKVNKKAYLILAFFILVVVCGFRVNTGKDFELYETAYNIVVSSGNNFLNSPYKIEPSFKIISYLSYKLFGNSKLLFFFYSFFTNLFFVLGIKSWEKYVHPGWATFIYTMMLYFIQFNLGRQMLAVSVVFFGLKYIVSKEPVKYILTVLLAMFFHQSAFVAIPLFIYGIGLKNKSKYKKVYNFFFYIIPFVLLIFFNKILNIFGGIFSDSKYLHYGLSGEIEFGLGMILQSAELVLMCIIYINKRFNILHNDDLFTVFFRIYVLACGMFFLQYLMTNFGGRIYLYFIPTEIILMGASLSDMRINKNIIKVSYNLEQVFLLIIILLLFFHGIFTNSQAHVPYSFRI